MIGKTYDEINLGDVAQFSKTVTEADVILFSGITGDLNPAHIDETYAAGTFFKTRIAHGMLSAGFVSAVLGMRLPGPGTIYLQQTLEFLAPVQIGNTVTARAEVIEKIDAKKRVRLKTTCTDQKGTVVLTGEALVAPPRKPK
ncbi:MAG: MaoC family dehydratase [Desulfopila sp.]